MGEWRHAEVSYLRVNRAFCDLCGRPLAGRCWNADVAGDPKVFCSPDHEQRYLTYWLPHYGAGTGAA